MRFFSGVYYMQPNYVMNRQLGHEVMTIDQIWVCKYPGIFFLHSGLHLSCSGSSAIYQIREIRLSLGQNAVAMFPPQKKSSHVQGYLMVTLKTCIREQFNRNYRLQHAYVWFICQLLYFSYLRCRYTR
jgi:hypothetical protein